MLGTLCYAGSLGWLKQKQLGTCRCRVYVDSSAAHTALLAACHLQPPRMIKQAPAGLLLIEDCQCSTCYGLRSMTQHAKPPRFVA